MLTDVIHFLFLLFYFYLWRAKAKRFIFLLWFMYFDVIYLQNVYYYTFIYKCILYICIMYIFVLLFYIYILLFGYPYIHYAYISTINILYIYTCRLDGYIFIRTAKSFAHIKSNKNCILILLMGRPLWLDFHYFMGKLLNIRIVELNIFNLLYIDRDT